MAIIRINHKTLFPFNSMPIVLRPMQEINFDADESDRKS